MRSFNIFLLCLILALGMAMTPYSSQPDENQKLTNSIKNVTLALGYQPVSRITFRKGNFQVFKQNLQKFNYSKSQKAEILSSVKQFVPSNEFRSYVVPNVVDKQDPKRKRVSIVLILPTEKQISEMEFPHIFVVSSDQTYGADGDSDQGTQTMTECELNVCMTKGTEQECQVWATEYMSFAECIKEMAERCPMGYQCGSDNTDGGALSNDISTMSQSY